MRDAPREATDATKAWDPSPPAIPITSAPRAIAASASCSRSSPGWRTTGSMPRRSTFVGQVELHCLPAAGLQVHDQHRVRRGRHRQAGGRCGDEEAGRGQRVAAERHRRDRQAEAGEQRQEIVGCEKHDDARDDGDDRDGSADEPRCPRRVSAFHAAATATASEAAAPTIVKGSLSSNNTSTRPAPTIVIQDAMAAIRRDVVGSAAGAGRQHLATHRNAPSDGTERAPLVNR